MEEVCTQYGLLDAGKHKVSGERGVTEVEGASADATGGEAGGISLKEVLVVAGHVCSRCIEAVSAG